LENKARYTLVGLFVLLFSVSMVVFILWQARYNLNNKQSYEYRIYTTNSIAGLNENSFVEYKGLNIGSVEHIGINPKNLEQIEIILSITNNKVIKTNSYAVIQSQGITGNKNIEISGGTIDHEQLVPSQSSYSVIPLRQSFLDNLTNDAQNITKNINKLINKVNNLLNQNNINHINATLESIEKSSKNFDQTITKVNNLLDSSINNLLEKNIPKTFENVDKLTYEWKDLSVEIKKVLQKDIKNVLSKIDTTLDETTDIGKVIDDLENTLQKVDDTLDNLNENGGDMIFKTRDIKYAPQERENEN